MRQIDKENFERELTRLCQRYRIAVLAGFFISRGKEHDGCNGVTVAAPFANPVRSTRVFVDRICNKLEGLLIEETPLPDAVDSNLTA